MTLRLNHKQAYINSWSITQNPYTYARRRITMGKGSLCVQIGILSLTEREDIHQFIRDHQNEGQIKLCERTLTFKNLLNYKPPTDWGGVILLHSATLGRLSLTDVSDARYDQLLKDLHSEKGKRISN